MKINASNMNHVNYDSKNALKKDSISANKTQGYNKNFDEIIIDVKPQKIQSDSDFLTTLKSKISAEIKAGQDPQRIEQVKESVYASDYNVNSQEIARKIMIGI